MSRMNNKINSIKDTIISNTHNNNDSHRNSSFRIQQPLQQDSHSHRDKILFNSKLHNNSSRIRINWVVPPETA